MTRYLNEIKHYIDLEYDKNPSFGTVQVPVLLSCEISKESPQPEVVKIAKLENFPLNPFSSTLHYGQSIFEGLKAYGTGDDIGIFRLDEAAKRFHRSAEIMSMACPPVEFFMEAIKEYVKVCARYMPTLPKHSLYLRPLLFASDEKIKVASSEKYTFLIMSSIVGDYFASADAKTKVLVSDQFSRAYKGGTGEAKTAANYALSLPAVNLAQRHGYQQVLYLDAETKTSFEELGGMNFFWVKDNELYTPKLNGQILHGITRKTIIEMAQHLGLKVHQETLTLKELLESKNITEAFACGTAATIVPIDEIGILKSENEIQKIEFPKGPVALKLRQFLEATHSGETEFSKKYLFPIK